MAAGETKVPGVRPRRSWQQASNASAHRAEWNPQRPRRPGRPTAPTPPRRAGSPAPRCAPGGVQERRRAQIRPPGGQHPRHERQLIVVHQDRRPGGGRRRCRRRELGVDGPKPLPRRPPVPVEPGPAGQIPEVVQAKPQRLVGNHVVVGPVIGRLDHDRLDPKALSFEQSLSSRRLVVGTDAGRHPESPVALDPGPQSDDEAAATAPGGEHAIRCPFDAEGSPVGEHQELVVGGHSDYRQYPWAAPDRPPAGHAAPDP